MLQPRYILYCSTWDGALSFYLPGVVVSNAAVRMWIRQESLADVVHSFVQLIRNVGCLENQQARHKIIANTGQERNFSATFTVD